MSLGLHFVRFGSSPEVLTGVSLSRVQALFLRFGITLPLLKEGSNLLGLSTPIDGEIQFHEEVFISFKDDAVTGFAIDRPSSEAGRNLWLALIIELGFTMIKESGGPIFASAETFRESSFLMDYVYGGFKVVDGLADLP